MTERRAFASDIVLVAMATVTERITTEKLDRAAVDAWAKESAEMYCAYVESIARGSLRQR